MKVFRLFCLALTLAVGLSLPQATAERMTVGISIAVPGDEAAAAACADCCAGCDDFSVIGVCPIHCGAIVALPIEAPRNVATRTGIPAKANVDGNRGLTDPPDPAPPKHPFLS